MRAQTLAPKAQTLPQKAQDPLRSLRVGLEEGSKCRAELSCKVLQLQTDAPAAFAQEGLNGLNRSWVVNGL